MTDPAPHDPDQLASDIVDGLVPPDEAARWRADPAIGARVARIEALRSALRSEGSGAAAPAPGAVDRMVAAAVAAAASPASPTERRLHAVPPPPPPHTAHPSPPPRPAAARPRSAGRWLAAAAVVAVGLAFAGLAAQSGGGDADQDQASTSADDAGGAAESAPQDAGAGSGEAGDDRGSTMTPFDDEATTSGDAGVDAEEEAGEVSTDGGLAYDQLGAVETPEALAARVRAAEADGSAGPLPPAAASPELDPHCPGLQPGGDPTRGSVSYVADAVYQGVTVRVHVYDRADGGRQLVATDPSCDDVVDLPFSG